MSFMNEHTRISLDMDYVFNMISPKSPYGIQKKRDIKPYKIGEESLLERDFDETELLLKCMKNYPKEFKEISYILNEIKEIRHSLKRSTEGLVLDEVELFEIKNFMFLVKDLSVIQNKMNGQCNNSLLLYRCHVLEELLDPENLCMRTFYIYDSYSEALKKLRTEKRAKQRQFDMERKRKILFLENDLGIKLKLSGEVSFLKKDEEKLKKARECPYLVETASTMLFVTFKLKNDNNANVLREEIENIKNEEAREEYYIKKFLSKEICKNVDIVYDLIEKLGLLDFFMAKAKYAISIGGIRPILHSHEEIVIKNGRHLKLDDILNRSGRAFCPIGFSASKGVTVITGANMGGKTVNLKLAGMLTAMTQFGLFVPAVEFRTCLFDYIYFSIGDMQSIDSGLSTFGSEISGMIEILKASSRMGLILIDELARGTNPEEGYAISRAIVNYLKNANAVTLFTTHFDGITRETGIKHLRVRGLKNVDFDKLQAGLNGKTGGIDVVLQHMDYSLENVAGYYNVPKDAINIARLMGLDETILNFAGKIMSEGRSDDNGKVKS